MTGAASGPDTSEPRPLVIVDGSNASYGPQKGRPSLRRMLRIQRELREHGLIVVTIVDANLRHVIDEPAELTKMLDAGEVLQVPAGRRADDVILQLAVLRRRKGDSVYVLTNDLFPVREPEAVIRRIAFMVVPVGDEEEVLFSPPLETIASGPPQGAAEAAELEIIGPPIPLAVPSDPVDSNGVAETAKAEVPPDLLRAFVGFFLSREPPPVEGLSLPFTQIAGYLHGAFGGDFRTRFGYRKAKDFADALEANGYVKLHRLGALGLALYLEVTSKLVEECARPEWRNAPVTGGDDSLGEGGLK